MYKDIKKDLEESIGKKRLEHSLRVLETAEKLGNIYNEDIDKLKIAALLHDSAKFKDKDILFKKAIDYNLSLDNIMLNNSELIHGPLGAKIAEHEYNIKDKDILNAIKYHTTGRENMTMIEKIIFISDYIEPVRDFPGVDKVRELAFKDLDGSLILAMKKTIKFLIDNDQLISVDTVKAINYLKIKSKE